jgi:hypothetical protein
MRKTEQKLWDRMRINLKGRVHMERHENLVDVGAPDVTTLARPNVVCRVELKAREKLPAKASTPILGNQDGLSIKQRNWHMEWQRAGGISYILIGCERNIWTIDGALFDAVNSFTLDELDEHSMASNWTDLAHLLGAQ